MSTFSLVASSARGCTASQSSCTRASFTLECSGQCSVACCIAGDVARGFLASCREGDIVAVDGIYEPHPSTASPKTPWVGRFRVRALRILELARIAA